MRTILNFRETLFWLHLGSGVIAGLVIGLMSLTGVALAFEHDVIEWADREARQVQVPGPDAPRLPVDALLARVRAARPDVKLSGVTEYPAPTSAVLVSTGRNSGVYVNPYTGEVRALGAQGWRDFFRRMMEWHRWLGTSDANRATGRAITGVCNAAFLFLGLSGLYLWWPRKWTWRTVRPSLWFRGGLRGKARDWSWHNVIGFWCLPVLIVLTASGMVISYKWASDLLFTLTGNTPPAASGPAAPPTVTVPEPPSEAPLLPLDALFTEARKQTPAWESLSVRLGGQGAQTFSIREVERWPLFTSAQVSLDPFTGQVLRRETFADYNLGRQLRTWMRFLHTGEALGWPGKLLAALASLGGVFLVWTGFALAWRRFFPLSRSRQKSGNLFALPLSEGGHSRREDP
jgi:uncharacterized iron-regulated membrane protein